MTKHFIAAATFAIFLAMPAMAVSDPPAWMMGLGSGPGGCGTWATAATGSLTDTAYSDWVAVVLLWHNRSAMLRWRDTA